MLQTPYMRMVWLTYSTRILWCHCRKMTTAAEMAVVSTPTDIKFMEDTTLWALLFD